LEAFLLDVARLYARPNSEANKTEKQPALHERGPGDTL
jgi:hypothetical protein